MKPLLNPISEDSLSRFFHGLPHAILLTGQRGTGLHTIATWLAGKNLVESVAPTNGTIKIETIRGLYDRTRTKVTDGRVIIIDDAETMSHGAQSAFLKLLEEPNPGTHFILTSHQPELLLPTVRSRLQQTAIQPLTTVQSKEFIDNLDIIDPKKQAQLNFIAQGLPAELYRLAKDDDYFNHRANLVMDARTLLQADSYEKLRLVQKYKGDRQKAGELLDSTIMLARRSLSDKPQPSLIGKLDQLLTTKEKINQNHHISLQLLMFVL